MKKIFTSKFWWAALIVIVVAVNFLASAYHSRIDLTKEKRYTLSPSTKNLLKNLDDVVTIEVFFKGNYPAGFKKIVNSVEEFLLNLRDYSNGKIKVVFTDPLKERDDSSARYFKDSIAYFYDISPYTLQAPAKVGDEQVVKEVIPGAVVHYKDTTIGVNLLKGIKAYGTEQEQLAAFYNNVDATLEYKFADAIQKITQKGKPVVAYLLGNGEAFGFNI